MDVCLPKSVQFAGSEKPNWMTDIAYRPLPMKCCRESPRRKRRRQSHECDHFSGIKNWVDGPVDDFEYSASQSISFPSELQFSPTDGGIGISLLSRKEYVNRLVMPDSRSEEYERASLHWKRRRLNLAENLASKVKLDQRCSQKVSEKTDKNSFSASLKRSSETIPKRYTLISNANENRPLVIKLRACPILPETSFGNVNEVTGKRSPLQIGLSDISSTLQPTVISCSETLNDAKPRSCHESCHTPLHQVRNVSTVVSSTTRCELKNNKNMENGQYTEFSRSFCLDFPTKRSKENGVASDINCPRTSITANNEIICQESEFLDAHRMALRQTLSSSNKGLQAVAKQHAKQLSGIVSSPSDFLHSDSSSIEKSSVEIGTEAVTSSSGAVGCEKFGDKNLNLKNSSKAKKTFSEFTKSSKSLDHASLHPHTNFQGSRRHARIFRRSTLVPQLHRQVMIPNIVMFTEDVGKQCNEVVNTSERSLCSVFDDHSSFKASTSDFTMQDMEHTIDEMESEVLNEILCDLPEVNFLNQEDSEAIPNILCKSFLNETERSDDIVLDEMLLQLPVTSSFNDSLHSSKIISDDLLFNLPSTSSSSEDLFISEQRQLIQLRNGVFCLLRTLVPQLHMPDRFDAGGHAVDELVDIVCGELSESEKELGKTTIYSEAFQDVCLNSSVKLCKSPGDCLSRLRCKVLVMLRLLLGIDLDEFDNENLLHSLLDTVVSANYNDDEELLDCETKQLSAPGIPLIFDSLESVDGEAEEEVSSLDSFNDIPELLVESERKVVLGDMDDFSEPPKLTAVDER